MNSHLKLACMAALPLGLFLLLRPFFGSLGDPQPPEISGRAQVTLKETLPEVTKLLTAKREEKSDASEIRKAEEVKVLHELEREILRLTNVEREAQSLRPLQSDSGLVQTSRDHGQDMCVRDFFNHINPDGLGPVDRIAIKHRKLIGATGENLWMGSDFDLGNTADLAEVIVKDWMESQGHRENILRPNFTHLGIGVVTVENRLWAVQNFAQVVAYLDHDLVDHCSQTDVLDLSHRPQSPGGAKAAFFDLWSTSKGHALTERLALNASLPPVPDGFYKLRFYFPNNDGFTVVSGPQIEVRQP